MAQHAWSPFSTSDVHAIISRGRARSLPALAEARGAEPDPVSRCPRRRSSGARCCSSARLCSPYSGRQPSGRPDSLGSSRSSGRRGSNSSAGLFTGHRPSSGGEIRRAGLFRSDGVLLGRWRGEYLRHDGPEHVFCFAPTRSGKGVGLVVPTLLTWSGSAIALFVRFWLTSTPPLPDSAQSAAQIKGRERYTRVSLRPWDGDSHEAVPSLTKSSLI
jgi:Type IV secretory system Conjugative DNA transfer